MKFQYILIICFNFVIDGKFILELARAREGERVSWVTVPRKTFWPPQGTAASTPSYRQESSASLSGKILLTSYIKYQTMKTKNIKIFT